MRWPRTVVEVICPPVSPKTPLLSSTQVTDSPRAAVWITSWRPSFTMSPSPCKVKISDPGRMRLAPVATEGARPWSAWTRSTSMLLVKAV